MSLLNEGLILHTNDGGINWNIQREDPGHPLNSVQFLDVNEGFVVGYLGALLYTVDGGNSWNIQREDPGYPLISVQFLDVNEGYEKWGIVADDLGSHRVFASTENSAIEMFKMYMDTIYINTNKIKSYKIIFKTCENGRFGNTTILS